MAQVLEHRIGIDAGRASRTIWVMVRFLRRRKSGILATLSTLLDLRGRMLDQGRAPATTRALREALLSKPEGARRAIDGFDR
eukprot:4622207-Pyramimonas_sp.AAC.1